MSETHAKRKKAWIKPVIILAVIAGLAVAGKYFNLQARLQDALAWIGSLGPVGYGVFALIYIFACVFFIPGSILSLGAGAIYGVVRGSVLVSISSTLGATAAFLIGRYFARDWISDKIEGNTKFSAIDSAVAGEGWKIVGLTRLSPLFPFNLLNYAYGLTKVSLRDYFLASWIGMMPGTILYVYIGSLAGDLAGMGVEGRTRTVGEWVLYGIGLVTTVVVTVFVTRIAKNALALRITDGDES